MFPKIRFSEQQIYDFIIIFSLSFSFVLEQVKVHELELCVWNLDPIK